MEIKDILELARLGYSKDDIVELSKLNTEDPNKAESNDDLKPGDTDSDSKKEDEVDPIEAIIERNKKEKGD